MVLARREVAQIVARPWLKRRRGLVRRWRGRDQAGEEVVDGFGEEPDAEDGGWGVSLDGLQKVEDGGRRRVYAATCN